MNYQKAKGLYYLLFCVIIFIFYIPNCFADDTSLVECLYDSVFLDIKSDYTAETIIKQKLKFNRPGSVRYSSISESVNRYVEFSIIDIRYIFPDSQTIIIKDNDIETVSDFGSGFYSNSKTKIIHLPSTRTGAIAVISYKLKYKSLLYLPQFFRQKDMPTYNSYLEVKSKTPYKYFLSGNDFNVNENDSRLVLSAEMIPAYVSELHMPPVDSYRVVIRPDIIAYDDNQYSFQSWGDVATFYNNLSDGKMIPNNEITVLAQRLCKDAFNYTDSIKALFDFVRDNIRYVSVEIGRGEFRPLPAADVYRKRYGDCKDKSALLIALLSAVGIKANPALIAARDKPDVIISLPWPGYFNHVITAVDYQGDYLFLDATQLTCCYDHLAPSLRNRRALVCGTESFLDFTLTSPCDPGNQLDFTLVYKITPNGDFRCDVDLKLQKDPAFIYYSINHDKALDGILYTFMSGGSARLRSSGFQVEQIEPDCIEVSGHFFGELPKTQRSNRLFVNTLSPFYDYLKSYFNTKTRINPYLFDFNFNINEIIRIELSDAFKANTDSMVLAFNERSLQANLSLISDETGCVINKNFKLLDYTLSAERYNRFFEFLLIASQIPYNSIEIMPMDAK
ncbi:MAG: hypothetical protein J7K40_09905 [candidate division Zixibacteria bacterium]|nr:hypothetical protein [candidate division Zixibacteria bacterium]